MYARLFSYFLARLIPKILNVGIHNIIGHGVEILDHAGKICMVVHTVALLTIDRIGHIVVDLGVLKIVAMTGVAGVVLLGELLFIKTVMIDVLHAIVVDSMLVILVKADGIIG